MPWGRFYCYLNKAKDVLNIGWKDNDFVLFATTIHGPDEYIERLRKRPAKTSKGYAGSRELFADQAMKVLEVPKSIDDYNHHMNGVDIFDQFAASYAIFPARQYKTWHPLWYYLLSVVLTNSYLLSDIFQKRHYKKRHGSQHRDFLMLLGKALITRSDDKAKHPRRDKPKFTIYCDVATHNNDTPHGELVRASKRGYCRICLALKRQRAEKEELRLPLGELKQASLSKRSTPSEPKQRRFNAPQSRFTCSTCEGPNGEYHICNNDRCWQEHLRVVNRL